MGKLRPRVRHPALPGTSRAKAGIATLVTARDAKENARLAKRRLARRKTTARKQD
jgi:hypothetical protein